MVANGTEKLDKQLQLIAKLLGALTVRDKNLSEGAPLLDRLGLDRALIAEIYATSAASVRGVLSKAKKGRKAAPTDEREGKTGARQATR
jgi:hypothetical protein